MSFEDYVTAVEAALVLAELGPPVAPPASALHVPDGSFHTKAAALMDESAVTRSSSTATFPAIQPPNGCQPCRV